MPRQGLEGILGRRWWPTWSPGGPVPDSLGDLGDPVGRRAAREAQRNRMEMRAKRYAQCGLSERSLQNVRNYYIFLTCHQDAKMGSAMGGARRYTQCHFVDMSDLKRFMLEQVRYIFFDFTKPMSIGANMKSLQKYWKNE